MFKINIAIICLIIVRTSALDNCPVLILDDGVLDGAVKSQTNPLVETTHVELGLIIDIAQKRNAYLIFFIEEDFSFEDITTKDEAGTPFYHMEKAFLNNKVKSFIQVFEPFNYIRNRFPQYNFNSFYVRQNTSSLRIEDNWKYIYIFFEDTIAEEKRTERLRRHDAIIQEVYFAVKQLTRGPVVAFYTGKHNPVLDDLYYSKPGFNVKPKFRAKVDEITTTTITDTVTRAIATGSVSPRAATTRAATTRAPTTRAPTTRAITTASVVDCEYAIFHLDAVMKNNESDNTSLTVDKCEYVKKTTDQWAFHISLTNVGGLKHPYYELRFAFTYKNPLAPDLGWQLKEVEYVSPIKGVLKTEHLNVTGEWDRYYASKQPLNLQPNVFYYELPTLYVNNYKIFHSRRPTSPTTSPTTESEGILRQDPPTTPENTTDPTEQEVYVTIGIATCGTVVGVMLGILFWGVYLLMSIRTNSIYDSIDQKPLYIADTSGD